MHWKIFQKAFGAFAERLKMNKHICTKVIRLILLTLTLLLSFPCFNAFAIERNLYISLITVRDADGNLIGYSKLKQKNVNYDFAGRAHPYDNQIARVERNKPYRIDVLVSWYSEGGAPSNSDVRPTVSMVYGDFYHLENSSDFIFLKPSSTMDLTGFSEDEFYCDGTVSGKAVPVKQGVDVSDFGGHPFYTGFAYTLENFVITDDMPDKAVCVITLEKPDMTYYFAGDNRTLLDDETYFGYDVNAAPVYDTIPDTGYGEHGLNNTLIELSRMSLEEAVAKYGVEYRDSGSVSLKNGLWITEDGYLNIHDIPCDKTYYQYMPDDATRSDPDALVRYFESLGFHRARTKEEERGYTPYTYKTSGYGGYMHINLVLPGYFMTINSGSDTFYLRFCEFCHV